MQGSLPAGSKWQRTYAASNPLDTDNGFHPQNILRLVTRSKWQDFRQEAYFRITRDQLSRSPNREGHNGLLLFNRYQDGQNLYYTGVRVDGNAVIKKKINGRYYTMAFRKIYPGTYNRSSNPNLLPKDTWIGLRSEVVNNSNGTATIKLYVDNGRTGKWTLAAEAVDNGKSYSEVIRAPGYGGIRTDFMDIEFDDYRMTNI